MKKLLFLGACLVALASQPVRAQTGGTQVAVVRYYEGAGSAHVYIAYEGGKTEEVSIEKANFSEKGNMLAAEGLQQVVSKLYREGYTIKSTFASTQGSAPVLIFVKEK